MRSTVFVRRLALPRVKDASRTHHQIEVHPSVSLLVAPVSPQVQKPIEDGFVNVLLPVKETFLNYSLLPVQHSPVSSTAVLEHEYVVP